MKYKPTQSIVQATNKWLGTDGHKFFTKVWTKHKTFCAVWSEGGIPHPVHFREGMTVRNFLRGLEETENWDAHDFDNRWGTIVLRAIGIEDEYDEG